MNAAFLYESHLIWSALLVLAALAGLKAVQWREKVARRGRRDARQGQRDARQSR